MNRRKFLKDTCLVGAGTIIPGVYPSAASSSRGLRQNQGRIAGGSQLELFVSVSGDDRNPRTISEPFATFSRAIEAVRVLKVRTRNPITVWLRGGSYYLTEPVTFKPNNSTTNESLRFAAFPGELVTLSGGRKLDCRWKSYRQGIMVCDLPEVKSGRLNFKQLFVNGKRRFALAIQITPPKTLS
jgi:hypothetical protein